LTKSGDADVVEPSPDDKDKEGKGKGEDFRGIQALAESFLGDKPSQFPSKKKDDPQKKEKDAEKSPDKTKKPTKAAAPPTPTPLTAAEIAAAAAEGVARAMPKLEAKKDPATQSPDDDEKYLNASDRRKIEHLNQMEKLFPDQYKNIAERYKQSKKALVAYAEKWSKENPDREFDETAPEHEEFFDKNDVNWEDEHYLEAVAELRAQAKVDEANKETKAKLSEFERAENLRKAAPAIAREQTAIAQNYWKMMGKEFEGVVDERGGVNAEKLQALQAADPAVFNIRVQFAERLDDEVAEINKLMGIPGQEGRALASFDPANPLHAELARFALSKEEALSAMPVEDQRNEKGQLFKPAEAYYKLPTAERARHWTFTARDLASLRSVDLCKKATALIAEKEAEHRAWAEARGIVLDAKVVKPKGEENGELEEDSDEDEVKPLSPSAGGETKMAAAKNKATENKATGASAFVLRSF
jgi:hypothetical protein